MQSGFSTNIFFLFFKESTIYSAWLSCLVDITTEFVALSSNIIDGSVEAFSNPYFLPK